MNESEMRTLRTSRTATASLLLGIGGLIFSVVLIGVALGVAAVILGHLALAEIRRAGGRERGRGRAIGGLVTGYISATMILLMPFIVILDASVISRVVRERIAKKDATAIVSVRSINGAIARYREQCKSVPDRLAELGPSQSRSCAAGLGLVDSELASGAKAGYFFEYVKKSDTHYELYGHPIVGPGSPPQRDFYTSEDGAIHVRTGKTATAESPVLK